MTLWAVRCVLLPLALLLPSTSIGLAATVTYDFDVGWVTANPDGQIDRPVIGINGQWPIPRIEAEVGDRIIVNVVNSLGNQSTSLHFHGLFMTNATHMDGPIQVSQCPIPPGSNFTYNFTVSKHGIAQRISDGRDNTDRSIKLGPTGTTPTIEPSIRMVSGGL